MVKLCLGGMDSSYSFNIGHPLALQKCLDIHFLASAIHGRYDRTRIYNIGAIICTILTV